LAGEGIVGRSYDRNVNRKELQKHLQHAGVKFRQKYMLLTKKILLQHGDIILEEWCLMVSVSDRFDVLLIPAIRNNLDVANQPVQPILGINRHREPNWSRMGLDPVAVIVILGLILNCIKYAKLLAQGDFMKKTEPRQIDRLMGR
jgi:hypothetical protein